MVNAYIKKVMSIEERFQETFNTNESLILQYKDCYACKLAINGIEIEEHENWLEIMQTLYTKLNDIIKSLADKLGINVDLAYEIIIKSM